MSAFKSGTYIGPPTILGGNAIITVSGPSVGPGGVTEFTLTAATGANSCTYPSSATWYVVGSDLASNPFASRLKAAGITSTLVSYGEGSSQCDTDDYDWVQNTLLGFTQTGNTLTIYSSIPTTAPKTIARPETR